MAKLNLNECRKMVADEGVEFAASQLKEWVSDKAGPRMKDITSLHELFEATVPDGHERLREVLKPRNDQRLKEAIDSTSTAAFATLIGQIHYEEVKEAYEAPEMLWSQLSTSRPTKLAKGERIPGIGKIGDKAESVGEGQEYPVVGPNEEYYDRGPLMKNGFITRMTRELFIEDNIGGIQDSLTQGKEMMAYSAEKRCLNVATGQINNYKRNGTATNTYLTSGAYTNSFTGATLYDFSSLNTIFTGMAALTDPNTGEYIRYSMDQIVVPPALYAAAQHATRQTQTERVDNTAGAGTFRTMGPAPFEGVVKKVLWSPYVKLSTSSDTNWFVGNFPKAIRRYYLWDVETYERTDLPNNFYRDIIFEFKATVYDNFFMYEPRYIAKGAP